MVSWTTSFETNSDYFDVQRSLDAKTWKSIGVVTAVKESSTDRIYNFVDTEPITGIGYYRLKMVDEDDSFTYSPIRSILIGEDRKYAIYPNPVSNEMYLHGFDPHQVLEVSILDMRGVEVYKRRTVSQDKVNLKGISAGVYSVIVKAESESKVFKLIVVP